MHDVVKEKGKCCMQRQY